MTKFAPQSTFFPPVDQNLSFPSKVPSCVNSVAHNDGMSIWNYSDWDSDNYGDAEKLSRLKSHIAELMEHNTGFAAKGDSIGSVPEATFARLQMERDKLQRRVDMASGRIGSGRNKVRFRRAT